MSSVLWGGNETLGKSHFNEIVFSYRNRGLKEFNYIKGVYFQQENTLDYLLVRANNNIFKRYNVSYTAASINDDSTNTIKYGFLSNITEYNSEGKAANSINFNTNNLKTKIEEKPFVDFENVITSGDYNGDGKIDFIVKQPAQNGLPAGYYLYFDAINNGTSSYVYFPTWTNFFTNHILTFNIKPSDNIIKPKQGLLLMKSSSGTQPPSTGKIEMNYYSIKSDASVLNTLNDPLVLEFSKTINVSQFEYSYNTYPFPPNPDYEFIDMADKSSLSTAKEIDIDSDGLSEVIFAVQD